VDEVLAAADRALYAAKDRGGDQVELCCPGTAWLHGPIAEEVSRALAGSGLEIFAQPILDLRAGQVTQYELLVRLRSGENLLNPAAFLEAAERLGVVTRIDLKVLTEAVRVAREAGLRLHVNVSGRTLNDREAIERMVRLLEAARVDPDRVVLEITEQTVLADLGSVRRHLETLRRRGHRLALDDFGAGFSSFHYLRHLPVDYVKIDGSLIRSLPNDVSAQKIVRAIAALIRDLGGATIAEWVEDEATLGVVRELGIEYAQGFYVGMPAPLAEILAPAR
jgi:EAL domain-containing protein (putative c-di-GMP-specific phosphodiesterase class I)